MTKIRNSTFSAHVTSAAFALTMSKNMIDFLARAVEQQDPASLWLNRAGMDGLERRGLVTVEAVEIIGTDVFMRPRFKVAATRAGKLVYLLCFEAGLIVDDGQGDVEMTVAAIELDFARMPVEPA
jgi:hypothetical protein